MNENHRSRGLKRSKLIAAAVICALFTNNSKATATSTISSPSSIVAEQLQSQSITGKITDSNGEPIIGASVIETGTTNGTITDLDGIFKLNVKPGATLKYTLKDLEKILLDSDSSKGYIKPIKTTSLLPTYGQKDYLYPIPTDQISLYKDKSEQLGDPSIKLEQNPGW